MEFKKKVDKMCSFGLFLDYALTNLILHEELGCWAPIKCSGLCQVYTPVHSIMTNDYNIIELELYRSRKGIKELEIKHSDHHGNKEVHLHEGKPPSRALEPPSTKSNKPIEELILLQVTL